ncbi:MAG: cell surface protein SprA, partial [Bacteroidota bacterium]|nr:cell surface protein SprA [Bacteroidota bacterium]
YFQYRVSLRPGEMEIGRNNITDILSQNVKLKDGTTKNIKWYQFKIPLNSPDQIIGDIQDFKSIQFVRMFLKNFNKQINIRFASLEVVRSEWRKYDFSLITPGEYIANDNLSQTSFEATTVNIEENGKRTPVPYVLPPGIDRQINVGTSTLSHMNEQSLSLKVCNLQDGDARAIYKTTQFDFRLYKTLNMFAHLEGTKSSNELKTGDLTVFIRLGTDFVNDYYEYEVPLTPTAWGASNPNDIWPSANNFQVTLSKLGDAKLKRNAAMRISGSNVSIKLPYVVNDGANKITVVGTPNLSDVRTIMIGVRNTKKGTVVSDDGLPKCGEVWVDELRLTDFDESGGWAANARFSTNLADLGDIALAGTIITPGFGGIEQKLNDRSKDTKTSFDMASNLELGKFFPEKSGLKIPMHVDYSQSVSTPKYDPLNPDELFSSTLNSLETQAQKDSVKKMSQDVTTRKSINFVNVRKNRVGGTSKSHFYDVENFDLTYSYSQENHSNIDYEYDYKKSYKGAIGYTFNNNPKNVMPFAKVLPSWSVLKLIKDFNFYYSPRSFSFRTDLDREYNETKLRNTSGFDIPISATSIKSFMWNRAYNLRYDLAQSLKFDYTANAQARIDEPQGVIDNSDYQHSYKYNKEFILDGIKHLGRITNFNQSINLNYTVPINKIPLFNWVTSTFKYGADYHWTASPLSLKEYGNQIENSNTKQINASFSFTQLYNKIPYLKKINQPPPKKPVNEEEENKKDTVKVSLKDRVKEVTDNLLKVLMGIKNASVNYSESNGTLLPGFMPSPQYFGMNWKNSPGEGQMAPGLGFVLGEQYSNPDFLNRAINNKWVSDSAMNSVFMIKHSYNFNARLSAEPIKDLKIELNAMRVFTQSQQTYFGVDSARNLNIGTPIVTGNYSISFFTLFTAFKKDNGNNINPVFETFLANRIKVATTLKLKNPNYIKGQLDSAKIFPLGYGGTSQQVLIPAFLGAYTNTDPTSFLGNLFMKIPKPNWRITYDGLSKLELMKRYFKTVTLSHSYTSTYSIGGYTSDIAYKENFGIESARDINGNFVPKYDISQISISESFAPLLGIDVSWKNSLLTKFEIKRSRNLALSLVNSQLIEVYSNEYVIGAGYRFKDVKFALITRKKTKQMKSDLNLKLDIGIRDNRTTIRNVSDDVNTVSAGQLQLTLHSSADYVINERFTVRLFFDYTSQNPYVSLQFPNSQINSGISIRFTLAS